MRKPKNGKMVAFYAIGGRYERFKEAVPEGRVSAHLDALIRFFLDNRDKLVMKYGGPEVGEYLEYKP